MTSLHLLPADPLAESLGQALLHSLWQGGVWALGALVLLRLIPARCAHARYLVTMVGLFGTFGAACCTWSFLSLPVPQVADEHAVPSEPSRHFTRAHAAPDVRTVTVNDFVTGVASAARPAAVRMLQSAPPNAMTRDSQAGFQQAAPWMVSAWLIGVCFCLARSLGQVVEAQRLRAGTPIADNDIRSILERIQSEEGVRRTIRLVASLRAQGPAVIGILKPVIVIPAALVTGLTPAQWEAVLAHEIAHIRRWDYLVNLTQLVIESLLFFNPAVWWLSRQVRIEREACCDAWAVRITSAPVQYANLLVDMAERSQNAHRPCAALAIEGSAGARTLLDRVRRIVSPARRSNVDGRGVAGAALLALIIIGMVGLQLVADLAVSTAAEILRPAQDGQLVLRGRVVLADGSPAVSATIASLDQWCRGEATATTDKNGRFELADDFGFDCRIHVRSADGAEQTTWRLPALEARTIFLQPVEITLEPAITHTVRVVAEGRPVEGAYLVAIGHGSDYRESAVTGPDGRAILQLPANEALDRLSAWHATRGIRGVRHESSAPLPELTELELLKPAPHTFRFSDSDGAPIPDLPFTSSVNAAGAYWIHSPEFSGAQLTTDADGSVTVPWFPAEFKYVDVNFLNESWKLDNLHLVESSSSETTVSVLRTRMVEGRLEMPNGVNPTGLLLHASGFGSGDGGRVHMTTSRARADGTFSLPVCADHVYFLTVIDTEWASDEWTGVILLTDESEPADIVVPVYKAIPVEIQVVRGSAKHPVPDAYVAFEREQHVDWRTFVGEDRSASSGIRGWLRTDAGGVARAGLGRGSFNFRVSDGDWQEQSSRELRGSAAQSIEFHRPWEGTRTVAAQLLLSGEPFQTTADTRVVAWGFNRNSFHSGSLAEPSIRSDGSFTTAFDAEEVCILVQDRNQHLSSYLNVGPDQEAAELELRPVGTYSGRLVDQDQHPLPGIALTLELVTSRKIQIPNGDGYSISFAQGPDIPVSEATVTDADGAFRFTDVPADVPLRIRNVTTKDPPGFFGTSERIQLQSGEDRSDVVVTFRHYDSTGLADAPAPVPPKRLTERLKQLLPAARVSGMHALIVLEGDASPHVTALSQQAVSHGANSDVLKYRTMVLSTEDRSRDADALSRQPWPQPEPGQVILVALTGTGEVLGTERLAAHDATLAKGSLRLAADFIAQHAPPTRDARRVFEEARALAVRTDRRIWLVSSGPRCGPCFSLALWMESQHELLEKDYVIVKVGICDEGADEVMQPYDPDGGIPWHVILDAQGKPLITSNGPLGNIGFPGEVESLRHFRLMLDQTAMRLTDDERLSLVTSLERAR